MRSIHSMVAFGIFSLSLISMPLRARANEVRVEQETLLDWGGSVINKVKAYAIFWGPNVSQVTTSIAPPFMTAMVNSTYQDALKIYNTEKPGQCSHLTGEKLERGSFKGAYTITPADSNTTLSSKDILDELTSQFANKAIPAPDYQAV